jgi:hypothetical protein
VWIHSLSKCNGVSLAQLAFRICGLILPHFFNKSISEQNEEISMGDNPSTENVNQETIGFLSENAGLTVNVASSVPRPFTNDSVDVMYLSNFLSRPVNILSYTWLETDSVNNSHSVEPWYAFFNDTRIKDKLNNFAFIQCTLKVKIIINASPFYYGAVLAHYQPLHNLNPSTVELTSSTRRFIQYSQRPHIWVYPQSNEGGELQLPYLNYRNWTRTHLTQDFKDLGKLFIDVVDVLKSANGATGTGVVVSVFAWAENVTTSGSTLATTMAQGGDEYGIVSKPSSKIATMASYLTKIPLIGPFARATEIGAGALRDIAKMFGFTNVPNLSDVQPFQPRPYHNFADTSISFPIDKLTVDPKNELSISQEVAGIKDEGDPLCIDEFIKKESLLSTFKWNTTNAAGTLLWKCDVSPMLCDSETDGSGIASIQCTPMGYAAAMFGQWRGDIIFRFTILASKFHKGRIVLVFDPLGDSTNNIVAISDSFSGCYNQIVDLGEETNVEFRVPYSQATYFQNVPTFGVVPFQTSSFSFTRDISKHNGTLAIRCLTALTAPIASSEITILVSARSANVEFANPSFDASTSLTYSLKYPQGGNEYASPGLQLEAGPASSPVENMYDIVYGERVVSFRQLIKRMNLTYIISTGAQVSTSGMQSFIAGRTPASYGYSSAAITIAKGIINPALTVPFNWSPLSPLTWLLPCFVGQRGSVNYAVSYGMMDGKPRPEITVNRIPSSSVINNIVAVADLPQTNSSTYARIISTFTNEFVNGGTLSSGYTNHGFEFQVPQLSQYKFISTNVQQGSVRNTDDGSDHGCFRINMRSGLSSHNQPYHIYSGAGTDFNLIFFLNVPTVYNYGTIPLTA